MSESMVRYKEHTLYLVWRTGKKDGLFSGEYASTKSEAEKKVKKFTKKYGGRWYIKNLRYLKYTK